MKNSLLGRHSCRSIGCGKSFTRLVKRTMHEIKEHGRSPPEKFDPDNPPRHTPLKDYCDSLTGFEYDSAVVYVLEMSGGNYYVGLTKDFGRRLENHKTPGSGAKWTRNKEVVGVVSVSDRMARNKARELEDELTEVLMDKYGWENVRGGVYNNNQAKSRSELDSPTRYSGD